MSIKHCRSIIDNVKTEVTKDTSAGSTRTHDLNENASHGSPDLSTKIVGRGMLHFNDTLRSNRSVNQEMMGTTNAFASRFRRSIIVRRKNISSLGKAKKPRKHAPAKKGKKKWDGFSDAKSNRVKNKSHVRGKHTPTRKGGRNTKRRGMNRNRFKANRRRGRKMMRRIMKCKGFPDFIANEIKIYEQLKRQHSSVTKGGKHMRRRFMKTLGLSEFVAKQTKIYRQMRCKNIQDRNGGRKMIRRIMKSKGFSDFVANQIKEYRKLKRKRHLTRKGGRNMKRNITKSNDI